MSKLGIAYILAYIGTLAVPIWWPFADNWVRERTERNRGQSTPICWDE